MATAGIVARDHQVGERQKRSRHGPHRINNKRRGHCGALGIQSDELVPEKNTAYEIKHPPRGQPAKSRPRTGWPNPIERLPVAHDFPDEARLWKGDCGTGSLRCALRLLSHHYQFLAIIRTECFQWLHQKSSSEVVCLQSPLHESWNRGRAWRQFAQ